MSDLMRKEFEAACEFRFNWALQDPYRDESERTLSTWDGETYRNRIVQGMWWAWQASRECLVIERPPEPEYPEDPEEAIDDSHMDSYHSAIRMRNACRDSIHAAGVKTK